MVRHVMPIGLRLYVLGKLAESFVMCISHFQLVWLPNLEVCDASDKVHANPNTFCVLFISRGESASQLMQALHDYICISIQFSSLCKNMQQVGLFSSNGVQGEASLCSLVQDTIPITIVGPVALWVTRAVGKERKNLPTSSQNENS